LFRHIIHAFLVASHVGLLNCGKRHNEKRGEKTARHVFIESMKEKAILKLGENIDQAFAPYGMLLLRVAIGIDWLAHAYLKVYRGMYTHEALLAKNGITPLLAWPTFTLEVIGGIAIILGWYSRQWAAFLLFFLATVVWIKWPVGWTYSNTGGGWEYPLFWLFAQAALVLGGEGAFALRARRFGKMA
jgi:putative oxidoreductase